MVLEVWDLPDDALILHEASHDFKKLSFGDTFLLGVILYKDLFYLILLPFD